LDANVTNRRDIPPLSINPPARIKNGTAIRLKLLLARNIFTTIANRSISLKNVIDTTVEISRENETGISRISRPIKVINSVGIIRRPPAAQTRY
jgi:hypothetical protein